MNTTKIQWTDVNLPINSKTIQELEEGYYMIETMEECKRFKGIDEKTKEVIMERETEYRISFLEVSQGSNCKIGVVNGSFACDYKHKTIIKISKLEVRDC